MKIAATTLCMFISFVSLAQLNVIPYAGISNTRMRISDQYRSGGNFPVFGIDVEWRRNALHHRKTRISLATGLAYLKSSFYYSSTHNFTFGDSYIYDHESLRIRGEALHVPFMIKINIAPFPLIEQYEIFAGVGLSNYFRGETKIAEEYTGVEESFNYLYFRNTGPIATHFHYSEDATDLGNKYVLYGRIEAGIRYRRIQLSFRVDRSLTATYFEGLESTESFAGEKGIPYAAYVYSYEEAPKKFSQIQFGLAMGFRLLQPGGRYDR